MILSYTELTLNINNFAEVTHEHIPLTIGYITEYTGPFFDWDTYSFTITATTDWEDTIQEEY